MPQRDIFESRLGIRAHDARQAADLLGVDGIAFVGHRRAALLPPRKVLFRLANLSTLQVADFKRDLLTQRGGKCKRRDESGVAVPLDNLRADRRRREAQPRADFFLRLGPDVGKGSNRSGDLAHTQSFSSSLQPHLIAAGLFVPDGQLQPEGDRLRVHSVRPADLWRVAELQRPPLQNGPQPLHVLQEDSASLAKL